MSFLSHFGERSLKNVASVALIMLSMTACAAEKGREIPPRETPPPREESSPIDKVTFTIDSKGNISVVGAEGLSVKDCSMDPEAKDRCSFYDKKIQVEDLQNILLMRYKGSTCVLIGTSTKARLVCYP